MGNKQTKQKEQQTVIVNPQLLSLGGPSRSELLSFPSMTRALVHPVPPVDKTKIDRKDVQVNEEQKDIMLTTPYITNCLKSASNLVDDVISLVIGYDDAFVRRFDQLYPQVQNKDQQQREQNLRKTPIMDEHEMKQIIDLCSNLGAKGYEFDMYLRPRGLHSNEINVSHQFHQGSYRLELTEKMEQSFGRETPEELERNASILSNLHHAFHGKVFDTFMDIERHLTFVKLYQVCKGDPTAFLVYKSRHCKTPSLYIRCPKCQNYCVPKDKSLADNYTVNPQPSHCPSSLVEIEADKTGDLRMTFAFQESVYGSTCESCRVGLYTFCNIVNIRANEKYLRLCSSSGGSLSRTTYYATIVRA